LTWTYTDEYYKNYTRDTWNESAPHYDVLLRNLELYTPALLRMAAPQPGERVLDVATGPGEPALTIAPLIAPTGRVVGIDLAEAMVKAATENARTSRRANAEFKVMDAEQLDVPDASFDLVVCRFGLQIVTDPVKAVAETFRVLKPKGRIAATVWTDAEHNPFLHAIVGPMLEHAEPDETGYLPTPYEMGGPGELASVFKQAGFHAAREERVTMNATFRNRAEYLRAILQGSPIGHSLREEDEHVQRDVLAKLELNLAKWMGADGALTMPSEAVVVTALK
jgi:ubiquinone/menaquinone biosynthesis C-methylase UbiE